MYSVEFASEVYKRVISDLHIKIAKRDKWRLARVEEIEFSTIEIWQDVIQTLQQNPFTYLEYASGIYLVIELYLPYILAYTVEGQNVFVFKAMLREEVYG